MAKLLTSRQGYLAILCAAALSACEKPQDNVAPLGASTNQDIRIKNPEGPLQPSVSDFDGPSAGSNTVYQFDQFAFSLPSPALSASERDYHTLGEGVFEEVWDLNQLAPLWNNNKCSGCHVAGGRSPSRPTTPQLLFRVSIPGFNPDGGPKRVPGFGDQIQPIAIVGGERGASIEGKVSTTYVEEMQKFADGLTYSLRTPTYKHEPAPGGPTLPAGFMISPRIGGQIAGLGLLEAVPEAAIVGLADPDDQNSDGISGRPNRVWDAALQQTVLGRFGWKANQPNLLQQAAAAFNGDLGITSPYFPLESNAPDGGRSKEGPGVVMASSGLASLSDPEVALRDYPTTGTDIDKNQLAKTAFYTATLGVPDRRPEFLPQDQLEPQKLLESFEQEQVLRSGQALFVAAKCAACHTPLLKTGDAPFGLGGQAIHPYTDLLLHDMGEGLADNRPDFLASGSEWRTAPLWGLGLSKTTSEHTNYLHDGRARNVMEAIMWHGGEGETSRKYVAQLSRRDRDALVAFVNSL